jgi:hypothetical protein
LGISFHKFKQTSKQAQKALKKERKKDKRKKKTYKEQQTKRNWASDLGFGLEPD